MPRFEHAGRFWSVELKDKQLTTQFGKIGSPGQTRLKTFKSPYGARDGYNTAIRAKLVEGYVERKTKPTTTKPVTVGARGNAQLEAAIEANPYDVEAYSVYADHLQAAGDPRGELIALQLANKTAAANKLLAKHADYFLGPLAPHTKEYDHVYEGGKKFRRSDALTWKYGFIHRLLLSHNIYAEDSSNPPYKLDGSLAVDVLAPLLAHPSGRFLAEIAVKFNGDPSGNLQDLIDMLVKQVRPTIRKLHLGEYLFAGGHHADLHGHDTEISWYSVGNLGKLWKRVPGLQHLIAQGNGASGGHALGGGMQLGTIELPNLVHAEFRTGGLSKANGRAIMKAKISKIAHLDVWFGRNDFGGDTTVNDVKLLLDRTDLPALRHLGLMNAEFADALIPLLATSKLTKQLTELDLSLGCMTDDGARAMIAHTAAFGHLAKLDVSKNYLSPDGIRTLRKYFAKKLVDRGQRDDPAETDDGPEYRHAAIGE